MLNLELFSHFVLVCREVLAVIPLLHPLIQCSVVPSLYASLLFQQFV